MGLLHYGGGHLFVGDRVDGEGRDSREGAGSREQGSEVRGEQSFRNSQFEIRYSIAGFALSAVSSFGVLSAHAAAAVSVAHSFAANVRSLYPDPSRLAGACTLRGHDPEVRGQRSEIRGQRSKVGEQGAGSREQGARSREQREKGRGNRTEVGSRRSEVRGRRAGSREQGAGSIRHFEFRISNFAIRLHPHHLAPPVPRSLADPYRSSEIRRLCGAVFSDLALPLWRILGTSRYALVVHQPAPPGTEVLSLACVRDSFYRLVCCRDRLC